MMTVGMTVLMVALVIAILSEWLYGNHLARTSKKYADVYRREEVCGHLANVRNRLLQTTIAGKLDSRSETFRMLYFLTTFIMRRPDQYKELAPHICKSIFGETNASPRPELLEESEEWDDEVCQLVIDASDGLKKLAAFYAPWQVIRTLLGKLGGHFSKWAQSKLQKMLEHNLPSLGEIRAAGECLEKIAHRNPSYAGTA